jgi:hypothetical protein
MRFGDKLKKAASVAEQVVERGIEEVRAAVNP